MESAMMRSEIRQVAGPHHSGRSAQFLDIRLREHSNPPNLEHVFVRISTPRALTTALGQAGRRDKL
jgi:hypothetical protein